MTKKPAKKRVLKAGPFGGIPQSAPVCTNSKRNAGILHRNAITANDQLLTPGTLTVTAQTEAGSTLSNVARNVAVSAGNRWGNTVVATGAVTPTLNQAVRIAFAAVVGADFYDIFLGTVANPLWVGRITEAQRQVGGIFSAVGAYTPPGVGAAGSIDVGIDGNGLPSNVNPFLVNNAWRPDQVTPVDCDGFALAHCLVKVAVTDLRSLPALNVIPFFQAKNSLADYFAGQLQAVSLLTATGQALEQDFTIDLNGTQGFSLLVGGLAGQGAAASVWVELAG